MNTIHDKRAQSLHPSSTYCNKHGLNATVEGALAIEASAYQGVISSQRKPLKQSQKWFDLPPQFIEIKRSEHVFRLWLIFAHETATGSRKHHYDDSEIKAEYDFRAQLVEGRNALALRAEAFWTRPIPLQKSYTKVWLFASYRGKNQSPIKTIVRNLIGFRVEYVTGTSLNAL